MEGGPKSYSKFYLIKQLVLRRGYVDISTYIFYVCNFQLSGSIMIPL